MSTERLLEKEEISAPEIWDIFHKAPRISQVYQFPVCFAILRTPFACLHHSFCVFLNFDYDRHMPNFSPVADNRWYYFVRLC